MRYLQENPGRPFQVPNQVPLPAERLSSSLSQFEVIGVDLTGTEYVKSRGKGQKAVHVETVEDLMDESFLSFQQILNPLGH